MVDLGLIFKAEEKLVNDIIKDIRENNFAWEVLQYIKLKSVLTRFKIGIQSVFF